MNPSTTREITAGALTPAGANLVDGFAAAMGIDLLRKDKKLQKALVDVDDGTMDGNLRMKALPDDPDPDKFHASDGFRGDGKVNMRDFRVFRDAFLEAVGQTEFLDGPKNHFKRDLNEDGCTPSGPVTPHPSHWQEADN